MTYREAWNQGKERLARAGVPEAELDAWYLLSGASGLSRAVYYMDRERQWTNAAELEQYEDWIRRREKRVPLQYITGFQQFMGLEFQVTPAVLIPRQDTETLVEYALQYVRPGSRVLDLCTGSGCIGISLAKLGGAQVVCTDISEEALAVARENGRRLGCPDICWIHSDLLEQVRERDFDLIVSNPPYIASAVIDGLMPEVREYEPSLALDGREDGLYFYRKLAAQCAAFLKPGGQICLEIGYDQGAAVTRLLTAQHWEKIRILQDTAGLDRVAAAWRQ